MGGLVIKLLLLTVFVFVFEFDEEPAAVLPVFNEIFLS